MRTYEDQLQMRSLFTENDLISAEIQNIGADGLISLHTRSLKYGKLENGLLVVVPSVSRFRNNQNLPRTHIFVQHIRCLNFAPNFIGFGEAHAASSHYPSMADRRDHWKKWNDMG